MIANVYKVKLISQASAIVFFIVLITTFILTRVIIVPKTINSTSAILFVSGFAILSYILWQKFVTGRTEWTISDDTLEIVWTKRPLERTKDSNLKWNEITKISKGSDSNYYHLKIELDSGDTLSFFHDPLTTKDDFESLIKILHQFRK
jgi:hypothetical protein